MMTGQMLCGLLASRICHDLINPIGAISNGVELLSMETQLGRGAELALVRESAESANARIRFVRVAFGMASNNQYLARSEVLSLIEDWLPRGRLSVDWQAEGDHQRLEVRRVFLTLLCLEAALPAGGLITVNRLPEFWQVRARAARLRVDEKLWQLLSHPESGIEFDITPARVQFPLLQADLLETGGTMRVSESAEGLDLVLPQRLS